MSACVRLFFGKRSVKRWSEMTSGREEGGMRKVVRMDVSVGGGIVDLVFLS